MTLRLVAGDCHQNNIVKVKLDLTIILLFQISLVLLPMKECRH